MWLLDLRERMKCYVLDTLIASSYSYNTPVRQVWFPEVKQLVHN